MQKTIYVYENWSVTLNITGLWVIGTSQEFVLQVEYIGQHLINLRIVRLLHHLEYDTLLKQITYHVVDAFLQFSLVCHKTFSYELYI